MTKGGEEQFLRGHPAASRRLSSARRERGVEERRFLALFSLLDSPGARLQCGCLTATAAKGALVFFDYHHSLLLVPPARSPEGRDKGADEHAGQNGHRGAQRVVVEADGRGRGNVVVNGDDVRQGAGHGRCHVHGGCLGVEPEGAEERPLGLTPLHHHRRLRLLPLLLLRRRRDEAQARGLRQSLRLGREGCSQVARAHRGLVRVGDRPAGCCCCCC